MHLFVDNLTNVDFSYLCPERGLLGETWLAHVQMDGKLDEQGMVCDFGEVKKVTRLWLDAEVDHRLLVPADADNLTLTETGDQLQLVWRFGDGLSLQCRSPRQAICLVEAPVITPANLARWSVAQLAPQFPRSVARLQVGFSEENIDGPFYHYSHGLKKHAGNCQRIAHGHRSRIDIWQNGRPAPALEHQWAERWQDIYIGTREDLIAAPELDGVPCYQFSYAAQQGDFELILPQACCYLIDTDSTVEYIASHIAATLKLQHPNTVIKVKAYEGLGKGAIAEH
ncbi:hypothetical protein FKG94_27565 [Exilibacterium tricleocarpae]|uniref:6-carboxy-5,6,7,8-tetrahydropterin synthase n=1 Tax=Exilibacterium tricleocarpae TaxID=2591008 RepID=A0A545SMD4_9GAMM|nr:6-carboxytetrahydropterin synthase [Exilibacterium tricleocarpae]TQV66135.1 hypothetical protein FKG94_27565 [Exilibacterium tricleocarpae]